METSVDRKPVDLKSLRMYQNDNERRDLIGELLKYEPLIHQLVRSLVWPRFSGRSSEF